MILLGLHGAMVADGYDDCEGDLLAKVRELAPRAVIGATLDPHAHLSETMVKSANLLICWKEYPHTDILERATELVQLCSANAEGSIVPHPAVKDTGMIALLHTTVDPVRSIVQRAKSLEGCDGIISVSIVHGFPWGDVADMGTKVLVYSDERRDPYGGRGAQIASELAAELYAARDQLIVKALEIDDAIDEAQRCTGTVVLSDSADNAGGGAPSDSTYILRRLIDRDITSACVGPLWDPGAVRLAFEAGEGADLSMKVGGKVGPLSGHPIDASWNIVALKPEMATRGLAGTPVKLGDCALIKTGDVEVVLTSIRCQAFDTDLFTELGCDPASRRIVVVKSSEHFRAAYARIARRIIYVAAPGVLTNDFTTLIYQNIRRPKWPFDGGR
jgi:microcystin degradation protein MlrC